LAHAGWQRTDVPINASFGAAVLGLDPPAPTPATVPVFVSPAPAVTIATSPTGGRPTAVVLPAPQPESVMRRLGFLWIWHRQATPGQSWSYTLEASAPYWAVALVAVVPYPIVLRGYLRRRRSRNRLAAGCCVRCGYDVRVTTSGRCPECGAELGASRSGAARDPDDFEEVGRSSEVGTASSR
jgi:hypothetical protein